MTHLKELFLLDPNVVFLNHGSYGAVPRSVFEVYQAWQRRLEFQPVLFLGRELDELQRESRRALGLYIHAGPDDLLNIPNATYGINIIARSLDLQPGDEVLSTDHEYGACNNAWDFVCEKTGAIYLKQHIPLPAHSADEITENFWQGVTGHTRVIYLSHITSPTALRLPIEQICARARQAGILTLVDAAHSPGQIDLDLQNIGADFVFGNCHKWMLSPKGAGFLYARKEVQHLVEPLIVSWGYSSAPSSNNGSCFVERLQWIGTRDPAAMLTVPAAIQFMRENDWEIVRLNSHNLLRQAIERICELTGLPPKYPLESDFYSQMGIAPLPSIPDPEHFKRLLYDEYKIEIPLIQWLNHLFIRISVQGYNTPTDIDRLVEALADLLSNRVG